MREAGGSQAAVVDDPNALLILSWHFATASTFYDDHEVHRRSHRVHGRRAVGLRSPQSCLKKMVALECSYLLEHDLTYTTAHGRCCAPRLPSSLMLWPMCPLLAILRMWFLCHQLHTT